MLEDFSKKIGIEKKKKELQSNIKSFRKHLVKIADPMTDRAKDLLPFPPLMGNQIELKEVAKDYTSDSLVKKGLMSLNEEYGIHHIAGDGHCLFRSIAAALLYKIIVFLTLL